MEVRTYGQYCPVARATEIVAMRWTPIIVRNLLLGASTFGEIQDGAPGIPRTLLSQRLRLLVDFAYAAPRIAQVSLFRDPGAVAPSMRPDDHGGG